MSGWRRSRFWGSVRPVRVHSQTGNVGLWWQKTSKRAKKTHRRTASGVWCSRRLVPWLRDYKPGMTGDGTKCTHQELTMHHIKGVVRGTHVADRETLETEGERERRGRNTWGGIGWVGGWMIEKESPVAKKKKKKKLVNALFPHPRTYFPLFFLLAFGGMWVKQEAVEDSLSCNLFLIPHYCFTARAIHHYIGHTLKRSPSLHPSIPPSLSLPRHMLTI